MLLGGFNAYLDGQPVTGFAYNKMRALLAYLAVEREQDHRRDVLSELLWNNYEPGAARNNLRRTLANLRKTLESPTGMTIFVPGKHSIRFIPAGYIDVLDFIEQTPSLTKNDDIELQHAERIVELYRGEFLSGLALPDCPDFEDWLQVQREKLQCRAVDLLERLSIGYGKMGDYDKAVHYALRQTELTPWDEDAHYRAIRFYALNEQTGAAIRQYEICSRLLKNELDVLPKEATRQLAESIINGEFRQKLPETPETSIAPIDSARPVERRQVTVLYCALAFSASEDPEEWLMRLNAPQTRCIEIIRQFSGHIVQVYGGDLLAYFGFPHASENAAIHAVQAALAITRKAEDGVATQVGIHTGVILADTETTLMDLAGTTSKLTIQMRNSIGHGKVVISRETQSIITGYFDCISLGVHSLPDFQKSLEIFAVVRESGARSRLDAASRLTPLVGRNAEIAELMRLWDGISQGQYHTVLIQGEAGIGKSRLLRILKQRLTGRPHAVVELRCFPEFTDSPFQPLIAAFENIFVFSRHDTPETKFNKLASHIDEFHPESARQAIPLLAQLLSLPLAGIYQAPTASPAKQKEQLNAFLLNMLQSFAKQQPVLFIVEDLHWIDPSTLGLLTRFVEQTEKAPVLALFTARPEFVPPWKNSLMSTLALPPLSEAAVMEMIAAISGDIPPETARRIVDRADGVPLFVEEITKIADLDNQSEIPATLHDLLMTRMDSMGQAKYTAQLAATVGREFDLDLLRKISPLSSSQIRHALRRLLNADLILDTSATVFQFKHALIQEAAYESQTKADRQAAHRRIASALIAGFPEVVEIQPELIARHFDAAGEVRQAFDYWLKAAQRIPLYSSNVETVKYLEAGLKSLHGLPDGIEKDRMGFALQVRLGFALQATQGFGDAAAQQAFYDAVALSKKIGNTPGLFQAQLGLCIGISSHPELGNNTEAFKLGSQLLTMAQESGNPQMLQQAHHLLGNTLFWMGDFADSRFHQEQCLALDPVNDHDIKADESGRITSVTSQAFLSWILWFQGFPEQAQAISQLSVKRARRFDHPNTLGFILTFASALQRWSGNLAASLAFAEEGILLARKMDFPIWLITNTMQQGWVLAMQGHIEGVAQISQCIDKMRIAMAGVLISFSAPLAETLLHHGQAEEALSVLNGALDEGENKHDHHFEAELHRLKGECLVMLFRHHEAEACFDRALSVSNNQGAKVLELRSAVSMARLRVNQGRPDEALHLLEKVYSGFAEGFDSPDLQAAARLLGSGIARIRD
ncbi:MAG: AAA family ATPase [Methylobacter sp.]